MIRRLGRRFRRDVAGSSALEFALIAGPLMLLMFGTIEFSRLLWLRLALEETATAAARCMGIPQPECASGGTYNAAATKNYIVAAAGGWGLAVIPGAIQLDHDATCSGLSGFSSVEISYQFSSAVPGFMEMLGIAPTLSSKACFPNQT